MMHIRSRRILAAVSAAALLFTSVPSGVFAGEPEYDEALPVMQEEEVPSAEEADEFAPQEDVSEEEFLVAEDEDDAAEEDSLENPDDPEPADELSALTVEGLIEDPETAGGQDEEALTAADDDDYDYDREHDRTMLPGWQGTVNGSYDVHGPDGWEGRYDVTEVEVIADNPIDPDNGDVVDDFHPDSDENGNWWYYHVANFGVAVLRVTYKDVNDQEQAYDFNLIVGGDVYRVYMDSVGRERNAFPGGEIELYTDASHEYLDENGRYHNDTDGLQYNWSFEQGSDYAEIIPHNDPSRATLKFKYLPEGQDWIDEEVRVGVLIKDSQGNETEAYDRTTFWVRSGYTEVVPLMLNRKLDVGASLENQKFEVRRYEYGSDEYKVLDDICDVWYEWQYDENVLRVTETVNGKTRTVHNGESALGNVFSFTRLGDWNSDYRVRAYWEEDGEERDVWGNYQLWNMNYDIGFDEHDLDVYTDMQPLPELVLDIRDLDDDWENRLDLELKVGHWTDYNDEWSDLLTKDTDYTVETDYEKGEITFTLTQSYLDEVVDHDDVRVWAGVWLKDTDHTEKSRLRDTDAWFHIEKARSEYEFEWDEIRLLPGWDHKIERWQWAWVCGSAVPDGEWEGDVEVLSVNSSDPDIAEIEYNDWINDEGEEDHEWRVRAKRQGQAQITLTFRDWDGVEKDAAPFIVTVDSERYDIDIWHEGDSNISLPGGSIVLHADIQHHIRDPKTGEYWDESPEEIARTVQFAWSIKDDEQSRNWIDYLEFPENDEHGDTAIVHLKDLPDNWEGGIWRNLGVEVRAVSISDPEDVKAWRGQYIVISDSYYELWVPGFDDGLWPAESQTVTPELRHYPSRTGDTAGYDVITEDVYFRWEYDKNAVEVRDSAGQVVGNYDENGYMGSALSGEPGTDYTIKRLTDWDTGIKVKVDYIDDNGDRRECEWGRDLWGHDMDFWFDTPGGNNIYTDGSRKAVLNLENYEDAPIDLYSLKYEVSAWFPKDEQGDEWEERPVDSGWYVSGEGFSTSLLLDGAALAQEYEGIDHFNVHAIVTLKEDTDVELADNWQDYWLSDPWFNYYDGISFGDDSLFFGETRTLNGYYDGSRIRLHNSAFPDGEDYPFVITSVTSVNEEEDPDDPRLAVEVEEKTDQQGRPYFELTAVRSGRALITLGLDILDEETLGQAVPDKIGSTTVSYGIWVGDFRAWFDVRTDSDVRDVLAGDSIRITPKLYAERQNPEFGYNEPVDTSDYVIEAEAWTEEVHEDGFDDWDWSSNPLAMCSLDEEAENWLLQVEEGAPDQRVRIEFRAYDYDHRRPYGEDNRWQVAGDGIDIEVTRQVHMLEIDGWNENVMTGDSVTITPSVVVCTEAGVAGIPYESEDLFYRIESWYEGNPDDPDDQSDFEIVDANGKKLTYNSEDGLTGEPPFNVRRLADWDTGLDVVAYDKDMRGNPFEVARRRLSVRRESYPVALTGKAGRGDNWNTWFYSNETDIAVTADLSALAGLDPDKLEVEMTYGRRDYDSEELKLNPLKNYTYNPEDGSCTPADGYFEFNAEEWSAATGLDLSGSKQDRINEITAILGEQDGGFHVRLRVLYGEGDEKRVLADELIWVEIRWTIKELEDDGLTTLIGNGLVGGGYYYGTGEASLYVEDADHCGGNDRDDRPGTYYDVQITNMTSSDETILKPVHDEDGIWRIEALKGGFADITYTFDYTDEHGNKIEGDQHTSTMQVVDTCYFLSFTKGERKFDDQWISILAGGTEQIRPNVWMKAYNEEKAAAGDEYPYDWEELDDSRFEVQYRFYNERFISVAEDGIISATSLQGNTDVNVAVWVYDSEDPDHTGEDIWHMEGTVHVSVVTRDTSLDLSEETVYALPGEAVQMEDLKESIAQHFRVRSIANPEWKAPENLDPEFSIIWFNGEPDSYPFMTLADAGIDTDYQTLKIDENILDEAAEENMLSEDGTYETEVRISMVKDLREDNWLYAEGGLKLVVHTHQGTHTEAVPATCEETGRIEYWTCEICGKYFGDEACTEELTQEEVETPVPALGHAWGAATYTWAEDNSTVTATRVCANDKAHEHDETETAEVTSEVTIPATCETMGKTTYTSKAFTNPEFKVQAKTLEDVPALGHAWGEVTYTWAEDNSTVTATRICANNSDHKETETVVVTGEVTTPATYTQMGKTTYTSEDFTNQAFEQQTRTETDVPKKSASDTADENLAWSISDDGTLTISVADGAATGATKDEYTDEDPAPWIEAAKELGVTKIVVAEGVTKIGSNAFAGLDNVTDVSLPKSLEEISPTAFDDKTVSEASFSFAGTNEQWESMTEGTALADKDVSTVHEHTWSEWETVSKATIFKAEQQKRTCSGCGETETRANGKKLRATIRLSAISGQIAAGKKVQIAAQILPGNVKNYPLRWTSSNTSVATVSATGLVSVNKKAGGKSVVITAISKTDPSEKASFKITVMKGAVKKIKISGKKNAKAGKSVKLKAKVTTTKGKANKKLKWTSSNTAWAAVAANGKVTTKAAGKGKKVTITAMATDGSGKKKTFKIKIK